MKLLSLLLPFMLMAQVSITGVVKDADGTPVPAAKVELLTRGITTETDSLGAFLLYEQAVSVKPVHTEKTVSAFNTTGKIEQGILRVGFSQQSTASIYVYDLSGRLIRKIGKNFTAGVHTVELNDLAAGVYLYRVELLNGEMMGNARTVRTAIDTVELPAESDILVVSKEGFDTLRMVVDTFEINDTVLVLEEPPVLERVLMLGKAVDQYGTAVSGATVSLKSYDFTTTTDSWGEFKLEAFIPEDEIGVFDSLLVVRGNMKGGVRLGVRSTSGMTVHMSGSAGVNPALTTLDFDGYSSIEAVNAAYKSVLTIAPVWSSSSLMVTSSWASTYGITGSYLVGYDFSPVDFTITFTRPVNNLSFKTSGIDNQTTYCSLTITYNNGSAVKELDLVRKSSLGNTDQHTVNLSWYPGITHVKFDDRDDRGTAFDEFTFDLAN